MDEAEKEQTQTLLCNVIVAMEDVADLEKTLSRLRNEGAVLIKKLEEKLK